MYKHGLFFFANNVVWKKLYYDYDGGERICRPQAQLWSSEGDRKRTECNYARVKEAYASDARCFLPSSPLRCFPFVSWRHVVFRPVPVLLRPLFPVLCWQNLLRALLRRVVWWMLAVGEVKGGTSARSRPTPTVTHPCFLTFIPVQKKQLWELDRIQSLPFKKIYRIYFNSGS